jgi:hypothetical protein
MTTENKTENKEKSKIEQEIEQLKHLNPFEDEFNVWNKEGTGYSNWMLLQLREAELKGYEKGKQETITSILQIIDKEIKEEKRFTEERDWDIVQELNYVRMQILKLQDKPKNIYFSGYHNPPEKTKHKEQKK